MGGVVSLSYISSEITLTFESDKCTSCGMCINVCPHAVFERDQQRKVFLAQKQRCMECGACQKNCPERAITVDSGVGCAAALIYAALTGKEPTCGCDDQDNSNGCC